LGNVTFQVDRRDSWRHLVTRIYPEGLAGRSYLDCACNGGGLVLWAREMGAGRCFGFDVREHWIRQAHFLSRHRDELKSDDVIFEACDLYDVPSRGLAPFDLTFFGGLFYHLPDPIAGLKIAADLTKEVLVVNTATWNGAPDGLLYQAQESEEFLMSGVYGLNWYPTGPQVMARILQWLGFVDVRCNFWHKVIPTQSPTYGRMELIASRAPGRLDAFPPDLPQDAPA
jgi:tRNA (mo5U34)-methyltransferase